MIFLVSRHMKTVIRIIASDDHCDTHQTMLSIRENKEGWFHLYCPGNICCDDDGELWGIMVSKCLPQNFTCDYKAHC